jgi:palmitoyltransferase
VESEQIVLRTEDGMPPRGVEAIGTGEWQRVWKLNDVENLYDLGFLDNLKDLFWPRYGFNHSQHSVSSTPSTSREGDSHSVN